MPQRWIDDDEYTGKLPPDRAYTQTRVRGQDWTTGHDQREERDGCQHGQGHRSELKETTRGESQSPLKAAFRRKETGQYDVGSLPDLGFVNLGSTACRHFASRFSRVRSVHVPRRAEAADRKIKLQLCILVVRLTQQRDEG